jgi:preprotein translocase subunit YajC
MKVRFLFAIVFGVALTLTAFSQDANPGQRGGRGEWGGMSGGGGVTGTVTGVAADHFIIKTDRGETYTIQFSANTRIMKQTVRQRGAGEGNPPLPLKSTDIRVGDAVAALGEVNAAAKSLGAVVVLQLDPERAKQIREMQADFGKTWLIGKVTAINETKVSIFAAVDNATHAFVADENTTFRKRREPITLADVQVGDRVRVEGAVKDGVFVAASVAVMGVPQGGTPSVPHDTAPTTAPQPN